MAPGFAANTASANSGTHAVAAEPAEIASLYCAAGVGGVAPSKFSKVPTGLQFPQNHVGKDSGLLDVGTAIWIETDQNMGRAGNRALCDSH